MIPVLLLVVATSLTVSAPAPEPTVPAPAPDPDPDPKARAAEHLREGERLYAEARFAEAAAALEAAHALVPDRTTLLAWAQALRKAGQCDAAKANYERYLEAGDPSQDEIDFVRESVAACEPAAAPIPADPDPAGPDPVLPPTDSPTGPTATTEAPTGPAKPTTGPTDARPKPRPWHRDPAGAALVGIGAAALVTGIGLEVAARLRSDNASGSHRDFSDDVDQAITLERAAIGMFVVGGALAVGGIVRYAVVAARNRSSRRVVWRGPGLRFQF